MAHQEQVGILRQGASSWNKWRNENPLTLYPALCRTDFSGVDLAQANLSEAILSGTKFSGAFLKGADFRDANLEAADLVEAYLVEANFNHAYLERANLKRALLRGADLQGADLEKTDLSEADLSSANLAKAWLRGANLRGAYLIESNLLGADLMGADLGQADLRRANLIDANLMGANLEEANIGGANLKGANLCGADLSRANLRETILIRTIIDRAKFSGSSVYSVNVWDLKGEFAEQRDLIITRDGDPVITVDNIKVAQFIYLILDNGEIRDVINTLTSKSVLILGRFTDPDRKMILNALRNKLREYNLVPIVFDFDRPIDRNITETIKTLAAISYFVIADVTSPKSSPLELQAIVPDYQIPVVPIIQDEELPFSMLADLQSQHFGVLDPLTYHSGETLIKVLKQAIIDPAIQKHNELRLIKDRKPKIRSAEDFIDKS